MTVRLPAGDAVPVASIDRAAGVVVTMDGQQLEVVDWADEQGELTDSLVDARFCLTGPDAYGYAWTVDIHRREGAYATGRKLAEHAR